MTRSLAGALLLLFAAAAAAGGTGGVAPRAAAPATDNAAVQGEGRKLFTGATTPSCSVCHTLRAADAAGTIGPDLDALKPDEKRVANAVQRGFENMPAFGDVLSPEQIDILSRYVAESAGR